MPQPALKTAGHNAQYTPLTQLNSTAELSRRCVLGLRSAAWDDVDQ